MKVLSHEIQKTEANPCVFYNVQLTAGIPKNELETAMSAARKNFEAQMSKGKWPDNKKLSMFDDQDCVRELVIQSIQMHGSPFSKAGLTVTDKDVMITPMTQERKMGLENLLIQATASLDCSNMTPEQRRARQFIMQARYIVTHNEYVSQAHVELTSLHEASP
jgi:hypothetical protein